MARRKSAAGRLGGAERARELVALVASLDDAGDTISADAVAQRLGVSDEEAEELLDLVLMAGDDESGHLGVYLEDDNSLTLLSHSAVKGRGVRLTKAETVAVEAALTRAGLDEDDRLRKAVRGSLSSPSVTQGDVERLLSTPASERESENLSLCASALAQGTGLAFSYRGLRDTAPRARRVQPRSLSQDESSWYLDAFDADARAARRFKLDRMDALELLDGPFAQADAPSAKEPARSLTISFADKRYVKLLHWPGLEVIAQDERTLTARLPYYGGEWLLRMLAACGGCASTDDESVNAAAAAYAKGLLERG